MLIRRETAADVAAISAVHVAACRGTGRPDGRVRLVQELRKGPDWVPKLSLVAVLEGEVVGHVCCSRGRLDGVAPATALGPLPLGPLALGPLAVVPEHQGRGGGKALMQAVLGAAMALDEPLVVLLGYPDYYRQFGFVTSTELGIHAPDDGWGENFMARRLLEAGAQMAGRFTYPDPFDRV